LTDTWADTDIHLDGEIGNETGHNLYGCFAQLYILKKQNRKLNILLSIGGWNYSSHFAPAVSTPQGRSTFASTAISLITNLGLDGLDIDWEYPSDDGQASDMVVLLQTVRAALDEYGNSLDPPYHFELTVACPAGPSNYEALRVTDMNPYVDFWNLMAYDYTGSWDNFTGDQANLFASQVDPTTTPFDTETAVNYYISKGVAPNKIVLGMPIYGRSFEATEGLGKSFIGVGAGTWQPGVYDFKDLPLSGATEVYNNETGSSYSYDSGNRELISYDTVVVAKQKAAWIQQMKLGGAMWWESSADGVGDQSLIQNVVEVLGSENLESSMNQLSYQNSSYDNLRAGMPELSSSLSTSAVAPIASLTSTTLQNPAPCAIPSSIVISQPSTSTRTTTITSSSTSTITISSVVATVTSTSFASQGYTNLTGKFAFYLTTKC